MDYETLMQNLKEDYNEVEQKWIHFLNTSFFLSSSLTKDQLLSFFGGFENWKFLTTSVEYNNFQFPSDYSHDLLEILYTWDYRNKIFKSRLDFEEWFKKKKKNISFFFALSGIKPPALTGTPDVYETLFETLHTCYRMRLMNNFALGYDYVETVIIELKKRMESRDYANIQEALNLSEKHPHIPTDTCNYSLNLKRNWEIKWKNTPSPITDLHELFQLFIQFRHVWAHKQYEINYIFPFQIAGESKNLKYKFVLFDLQFISNISSIFVKSIHSKIENILKNTYSITDPKYEGKILFSKNQIEYICSKYPTSHKLYNKAESEYDLKLKNGESPNEIDYHDIIIKVGKSLGIKITQEDIKSKLEYPNWW
jgi:hypothetical protein